MCVATLNFSSSLNVAPDVSHVAGPTLNVSMNAKYFIYHDTIKPSYHRI